METKITELCALLPPPVIPRNNKGNWQQDNSDVISWITEGEPNEWGIFVWNWPGLETTVFRHLNLTGFLFELVRVHRAGWPLPPGSSLDCSWASRPIRATPPVMAARLTTPATTQTVSSTAVIFSTLDAVTKQVTVPAQMMTTIGTSMAVRPATRERSSSRLRWQSLLQRLDLLQMHHLRFAQMEAQQLRHHDQQRENDDQQLKRQ